MSNFGFVDAKSAAQIQNLLICIEMLLASLAHYYIFPYHEWHEGYQRERERSIQITDTLAMGDFYRDARQLFVRRQQSHGGDIETPDSSHGLHLEGEEEGEEDGEEVDQAIDNLASHGFENEKLEESYIHVHDQSTSSYQAITMEQSACASLARSPLHPDEQHPARSKGRGTIPSIPPPPPQAQPLAQHPSGDNISVESDFVDRSSPPLMTFDVEMTAVLVSGEEEGTEAAGRGLPPVTLQEGYVEVQDDNTGIEA